MPRSSSALLALPVVLVGCSPDWLHPAFDTYAADHDRIAVLPLDYTADLRRLPRDTTAGDVDAQDAETGEVLQEVVGHTLRAGQRRVDVQSAQRTRRALSEAGLSGDEADPIALAAALGVDAIIVGEVVNTQYLGDPGAITIEVIAGATGHEGPTVTDEVDLELSLYDGDTGELLWTCGDFAVLEVTGSPRKAARRLARACASSAPYVSQ